MKQRSFLICWALILISIQKVETHIFESIIKLTDGTLSENEKPTFIDNLFNLEEDALIIKENEVLDQSSLL